MTKTNKEQKIVKLSAKDLSEAIAILLESSKERKFVESIDLAVNLGVDPKQSDQNVKGSIVLPHGSGKKVKIAVITANEDQQKLALEKGAEFAGNEELIAKISEGFTDFDCCIATPDVMPKISKIARKLGPRGLMPSPKNGTVTADIENAIAENLKGKINFKNDKSGTVHCLTGKADFDNAKIKENIETIIKAIKDAKPEGSKGKYIKSIFISTTMGPSVEIAAGSI
jgi:large subunit ribosomal protein L1